MVTRVSGAHMFIIHIGKHKTGSSSIQQFLATNADKLQQFDIIYPQIARQKKAHHNLVRQLKGDRRFGPVLGGWDEIRALAEKKHSRIVLSSEGFETLKEQQIRELKQRVGGVETTIVIYIRQLSSLLPSRYNQLTKKGINTDDFDQFYGLYGPPSGFNLMHRIQRGETNSAGRTCEFDCSMPAILLAEPSLMISCQC
jgi:hypothetical protein